MKNKTAFTLEQVREVAFRHDYEEISWNETSKVISFRGGPAKSTRINVYYTTGTIATCLNHPKRGKTQLFRRNITTLESLDKLFTNPRSHTGQGYYTRQSIAQQWKLHDDDNNNDKGSALEWDSAQRWKYVASATGLATTNDQLQALTDICACWDSLYWNKGDPPAIVGTRFACGSHGAMIRVLFQVSVDVGGEKCCHWRDLQKYRNGEITRDEIDTEQPYAHECHNLERFMEQHEADVAELKRKLKKLPDDHKIELLRWFLGRDVCGCVLINRRYKEMTSVFSDAVDNAHMEYADLMYPKKAKLCRAHGVLLTDDDEDQ